MKEKIHHNKTITNILKDNSQVLMATLRYFDMNLKECKQIGNKTIAIGSVKVRAQNSLKNNFDLRKI